MMGIFIIGVLIVRGKEVAFLILNTYASVGIARHPRLSTTSYAKGYLLGFKGGYYNHLYYFVCIALNKLSF